MRRHARLLLAIGVMLLVAAAGFRATTALVPERLHEQVEAWLARSTRAEAEIGSLRLVLGFPVRLEGSGLSLYGGALTVESASARIDAVSLLLGRPRLTRLRLDGAHLEIARSPEGDWDPPVFSKRDRDHPEPALEPLRAIERVTRSLLEKPLLADALVLRRSRVSLVHADPSGSGDPVRFTFEHVNGRLLHSRLFGDARLFLRVRLAQRGEERGRLEWNGTRDEKTGGMQITMAATGLDLSTLETYLRGARPSASLAGTLDGVVDFAIDRAGVGQLDLDLATRGFETQVGLDEPLRLPELALRMRVQADHQRVVLSQARVGTGDLDFSLDAQIARPLRDASQADVTVSLVDVEMQPVTARKLAGWLPASSRERMIELAGKVRSGRLASAELRGRAPLARWRDLLAGRLEHLPASFRFALRVEDMAIEVDAANRLEHLTATLGFENDTLELREARGDLNDGPLPELTLSFQGFSKLLAAPPSGRGMASSADALQGLTPLFEVLRGDPSEDPPDDPRSVVLTFEHLYHPALLWPLDDVRVELLLERERDGVRLNLERCEWAGVLLDGEVDWQLRPTRRLQVKLAATDAAPRREPRPEIAAGVVHGPADGPIPWMVGSFEMGPAASPRWSQRRAVGRFFAAGGELRLEDVAIELEPQGLLAGSIAFDLTQPEQVPYRTRLTLDRGDLATLIRQRGASKDFVSGSLGVRARFSGNLVPDHDLLHDADGEAELRATLGAIQRSVPPVLALALASRSLNPFSRREALRYEEATGHFVLDRGVLRTDDLEIEGPDIRLFAAGTVDLGEAPHSVDAEVGLFLFRQVDRALELIPIVNVLLLGENENLVAAYFQLEGTWEDPTAEAKPLRTLEEGPGDVITKTIPRVMMRGVKAIGGLFRSEEPAGGDGTPETGVPPAQQSDS